MTLEVNKPSECRESVARPQDVFREHIMIFHINNEHQILIDHFDQGKFRFISCGCQFDDVRIAWCSEWLEISHDSE